MKPDTSMRYGFPSTARRTPPRPPGARSAGRLDLFCGRRREQLPPHAPSQHLATARPLSACRIVIPAWIFRDHIGPEAETYSQPSHTTSSNPPPSHSVLCVCAEQDPCGVHLRVYMGWEVSQVLNTPSASHPSSAFSLETSHSATPVTTTQHLILDMFSSATTPASFSQSANSTSKPSGSSGSQTIRGAAAANGPVFF
ncbi:hypothetical protein BD413DRAFT_222416 [Trametes elegans]|nr:hypothetical protein BD413DRAFT_222416 [Trametes elegans]